MIIAQCDLQRKDTVLHDSDIDSQGNLYYTEVSKKVVWLANTRNARVLKIEPLD